MALRSLDPAKGYQPKARKDMSPDEIRYLDVEVPKRQADMKRRRAKSEREKAKDEAFEAMTEGHTTPEAVAKHLGWPLQKAKFILGDLKT